MRGSGTSGVIDSIRFVLQHPWVFITPIVVGMSITIALPSALPRTYETRAMIAFLTIGDEVINQRFIQRNRDFLDSILVGDNIAGIIKQVWPDVDVKRDNSRFNGLVDMLRNPKSGIQVVIPKPKDKEQATPTDRNTVILSYSNANPDICYRVLRATIDRVKYVGQKKSSDDLTQGMAFLEQQRDIYKSKVDAIDEKIALLKLEFRSKYPTLTDEEKFVLEEMLSQSKRELEMRMQSQALELKMYEDKLTDLKLQILELKKERQELESRLAKGEFLTPALSIKEIEDDTLVKGYMQATVAKQLQRAEYISQGFTSEHPQVRKIDEEIEKLKILRESRVDELTGSRRVSASMRNLVSDNVKKRITEIDSLIEAYTLKCNELQKMKEKTRNLGSPFDPKVAAANAKMAELRDLMNERDINFKYYQDIRQQLETAEIKSRLTEVRGFQVTVVEHPRYPKNPKSVDFSRVLSVGLMLSFSVGIALSYIFDALDNSVKSSSELRELLQVPVLASIDRIHTRKEIQVVKLRRKMMLLFLIMFAMFSKYIVKIAFKIIF